MTEAAAAREPLGVIGVGWVGLVTAVCFAEVGHEVWCIDVNREKVEALSRGEVTLHEPGIAEAVARNRERLHFGTEVADLFASARLAFICVDTPPTASGDADLSRVQAVFDALPPAASGALLVMKSTVPVGTGRTLRFELDKRGLESVGYASNPEFLREGSALADFMHPDRVVVGASDAVSASRLAGLYAPITDQIVTTDMASAELIKLASNAFLATKISFINEIANVCEEVDADVAEVARGMGLDSRIGASFLRPGIGYGGSCLHGEETVLVRRDGQVGWRALQDLFAELAAEAGATEGLVEPDGLEVLTWHPDVPEPLFLPVAAATRRHHTGELVVLETGPGRRLRCTPDHPLVVDDGAAGVEVREAGGLQPGDRLPLTGRAYPPNGGTVAGPAGVTWMGDAQGHEQPARDVAAWRTHGVALTALAPATGTTWVPVVASEREPFDGPVYSLEVPGTETFVTSGGLVVHNCFPKDVAALKQLAGNTGYHFQLLASVIEVNELQKRRVIGKLKRHLGDLRGRKIALWGLAFKPDTNDMREASSIVLAHRLTASGAQVTAYDPVVTQAQVARELPEVEIVAGALEAAEGADAVVIVTEWPEFRSPVLDGTLKARMAFPLVVDGRNMLEPQAVKAAGYVYEGVGRRASARGDHRVEDVVSQ